jgi:hypothetical protein|tara:strand:- start:74 stop:370 length:297 start_codon:yes stop_codon:yes gene_type:complete
MKTYYNYLEVINDLRLSHKVAPWNFYRQPNVPAIMLEEQYREWRDIKLQESDWRFAIDQTPSDSWRTYRQALRDLPTTSGWPDSLSFDNFIPLDPNDE